MAESAGVQDSVAGPAGPQRRPGAAPGSGRPGRPPGLSVIIPTLNEVENLPAAIASAVAPEVEIVVVDGGSTDGTVALAEAAGVRLVRAARGRGSQLAAGAAAASGDVLLFLHADAVLPAGYVDDVRRTVADPRCAVGAFRLRIAAPGWGLRLIEWGARVRSRWLALPYGDQGLFVRAPLYRAVGGFSALPAMEDIEFLRRARRRGRIRTLRAAVAVSSRTWERHGVLRFTLWNVVCAAAFVCGVSPARLARWRSARLARAVDDETATCCDPERAGASLQQRAAGVDPGGGQAD